jgi:hypothetical protein
MTKNVLITAFTGVLALTGIILSGSPTHAAEDCLAAPNSPAPPGSHWYYRSERSTQRKCWYMRSEDQQARAVSSKIEPVAKSSAVSRTSTTLAEKRSTSAPIERTRTPPAADGDKERAVSSVSEKTEPVAIADAAARVASGQTVSVDFPPMPAGGKR